MPAALVKPLNKSHFSPPFGCAGAPVGDPHSLRLMKTASYRICVLGFGTVSPLVDGRVDGLWNSVSKVDEHAQGTGTSDLAIPFGDRAVVDAGGDDVGVDRHVEGGLGLAFVQVVDEDAEPWQPGINRGLEGLPSSLLGHA